MGIIHNDNNSVSISHSTNLWTKVNAILGVANLGTTCWNYFDRNKDQEAVEMKRTKQISEIMTKFDSLKVEDANGSKIEELKNQVSQLIAQFQQQVTSLTSVNKVLETVKASSDGLSSTLSQKIGELKDSVVNGTSELNSKNTEMQELINTKHREIVERLERLTADQAPDLSFLDNIPDLEVASRTDDVRAGQQITSYIQSLTPPVKERIKSICLLSAKGFSQVGDKYNVIKPL